MRFANTFAVGLAFAASHASALAGLARTGYTLSLTDAAGKPWTAVQLAAYTIDGNHAILLHGTTDSLGSCALTPNGGSAKQIAPTAKVFVTALFSDGKMAVFTVDAAGSKVQVSPLPTAPYAVTVNSDDSPPHQIPKVIVGIQGIRMPKAGGGADFLMIAPEWKSKFQRSTDSQGRAIFPSLPVGAFPVFNAHGNGYALIGGSIVYPKAPPIHELKLQRVATLRGEVTRDGKPAAGVTVMVSILLHQNVRESVAKTAKDGTYTLDDVTEGECTVTVRPDDSIKGLVTNSIKKLRVSPGAEIDSLNLRLHAGIPLKVLVTTKEDGKPIAGRTVSFIVDDSQMGDVVTDSEGIASLAIPEGDIYVTLRDEGGRQALSNYYVTGHITEEDHPLVRITVPRALVLPPLKSVTGAVVDADGHPVSGATVTFLGQASPAPTKSGADGTYRFSGPILPGDHLIAYSGDRMSSKALEVDEELLAPIKLDGKAADISGQIVDENGKPMVGLSVTLGGHIAKQYIGFPAQKTDSNGVYRFPDLPGVADEMYLWVNHAGYGDASIQPIKLAPGESKNLGTLTMQPTDGVITGKVEDDNKKPVAGIRVNPQVMGLDVLTAADGTFKLTGIPRGKHWVVAGDDAHGQNVVELATGDSNVVISLPKPTPRKQNGYVSASDMTSIAAPELKVAKWVVGQPVTLAGLKGKVVLLDFWATTCGPCVAAFPSMEKFYKEFKDKGVVMIGVCAPDTDARVLKRLREGGVTYLNAIDKPDKYGEPTSSKLYGYKGTPHLIVVDQSGKIISDGDDENDAEAAIKKALDKPASKP